MSRFLGLLLAVALVCGPLAAAAQDPLNILVFGATGGVGTHIVEEALRRGHRVTAVSRDPSSITRQHERLVAARGDLLDPDSIDRLLPGQDVVISSVRGVIGDKADPANALQLISAKNIVAALQRSGPGAPRFIHVGGAGSLEVEPGVLYAQKLPKILLPKALESEIIGQVWALDFLRGIDDVQWTYATPPKNLTNGKRTGSYRIGGDTMLEDARGRSRVSRADFAAAILDEAERAEHVNQRFSVAY
jgi:putative NADH-flavin reductase